MKDAMKEFRNRPNYPFLMEDAEARLKAAMEIDKLYKNPTEDAFGDLEMIIERLCDSRIEAARQDERKKLTKSEEPDSDLMAMAHASQADVDKALNDLEV